MDKKGFYTDAASYRFHEAFYGGLAYHSLQVCQEAMLLLFNGSEEFKKQIFIGEYYKSKFSTCMPPIKL
ncbi:hypothetical protein [Segatella bryantii]|uniref:Uncharacterized protein n=1 Tax=Segatella bryantii TaxID=77095 RepID=A0ABX4EEW2_SEGBR|nr:hypothetical protein [Segatella bryantii]OYP53638.1 hypothetical protein CIK91_11730 [Segatella bryantii]UKK81867.1 hypothetical protein L6474_12125 [Segatella bryantii]